MTLTVMPCRKCAQFQIYKILPAGSSIQLQLKSIYNCLPCLHLVFHGSHFRTESGKWSGGYNVLLKWVPIPEGVLLALPHILLMWFVQRRSDVIRQPRYFASRTINSVNVVSVIGARGMKLPTGTRGMELPTDARG